MRLFLASMRHVLVKSPVSAAFMCLLSRAQDTPPMSQPHVSSAPEGWQRESTRSRQTLLRTLNDRTKARALPSPAGGFIVEERFGSSQLPSVPVIVAHRTPETVYMKPGSGSPFFWVGSSREPREESETRTSSVVPMRGARGTYLRTITLLASGALLRGVPRVRHTATTQ
jgi:hypothetical protein